VVVDVGRERFEDLVSQALEEIPRELSMLIDNVAVFVEDDPPPSNRYLLGLYEGIPLTSRDSSYGLGVMPDRITIFRRPILAMCADERDVTDQVRITVVHEVAHHFGIDDDRLHELGYG
jgi:predicted Zn-dependent protease with MMP-like domain